MTDSVRVLVFALLVATTIVGLAGTDLVLPAVPTLPDALGGSVGQAQLVLAAFAAGTALGFLAFGELGARLDQARLLAGSMFAYGLLSLLASRAGSLGDLIVLRALQGLSAAAGAVFAPGLIRRLFDEHRALQALGIMGSVESLVPALAPVLGYWLLLHAGWQASFEVITALALPLGALWLLVRASLLRRLPAPEAGTTAAGDTGYQRLLGSPVFLRYALSQAFTLGGLLTFVFGAPTVITVALGGTLADFVTMQVTGITLFIVASNLSSRIVLRIGVEPTILAGSALSALGGLALVGWALLGSTSVVPLVGLFAVVNLGLGVRGPPGFFRAVQAARGDDARGAALTMLFVLLTAALGTTVAAPWIDAGLLPLAAICAALCCTSVLLLRVLPAARIDSPD